MDQNAWCPDHGVTCQILYKSEDHETPRLRMKPTAGQANEVIGYTLRPSRHNAAVTLLLYFSDRETDTWSEQQQMKASITTYPC